MKKDNLVVIVMAEEYLINPNFTITDISYALGFLEPSSFQAAFKKWKGQTPGQYRKQQTFQ
jgi:AraC-like DNA-binding protein